MNFNKVMKWLNKYARPFYGSLVLIMILGAMMALAGVGTAIASKKMMDFAVQKQAYPAMIAGLVFFAAIVCQIGLRALMSVISVNTYERFANGIRLSLYESIVRAQWSDFIKYHSDDMLTRMTSDINVVAEGVVNLLPGLTTLGLQLVFAFATLLFFDPVLAVLAILIGPLCVLFYRLFSKQLKEMHLKIQETEGIYRAYLHECIQNISIIKVFSQEQTSKEKISGLQNERKSWVLRRNRMNVASSSVLSFGYYLGYMLSFAWGAFRLVQDRITFGTLTAFFQLVNQIQAPFISIARSIPQLIAAEGSSLRLMELENLKPEEGRCEAVELRKAGLILRDVSFEYKKGRPVIRNASVTIDPGEIVSIVGPSGEGKTTIIRLILSLLEKNEGNISLSDGIHQYNMSASLRKLVSYVPQGNTLFSGTILENLRIGSSDASLEDITEALREANALEFVENMKDGLNTAIGEKGIGLSEGQAQRLAIARALLRETPIMIFDEATSSLDEQTELKVLKAIRKRPERPTCVFITHRQGVYAQSDRVLCLENGRLFEKIS